MKLTRAQVHEILRWMEQLWAEISDLAEFGDGPLSNDVRKMNVESAAKHGQEPNEAGLEYIRAAMIAARCADLASFCEGPYKGAPMSMIMGRWAELCLQSEIQTVTSQPGFMEELTNALEEFVMLVESEDEGQVMQ
jgi:hypothetical protein